jgi:SAM-dependent methyltransferase
MAFKPLSRLRKRWRRYLGPVPLNRAAPEVSDWFETPLGVALLADQQQALDERMQCLFGYHMLQLSISPRLDLGAQSRISHRFALHPQRAANPRLTGLSDFHHLPLAEESVDLLLLHHTLDFTPKPHQLLRESARVLIPRGHLLIIGFNPWSLFGLGRWFARFFSRKAYWRHHSLRLGRVLDWLTLLDFETLEVHQGFFRPPLQQSGSLKHLRWLETWGTKLRLPMGGYYLVLARKDRPGFIPMKPTWQQVPGLGGQGLSITRIIRRAGFSQDSPLRRRQFSNSDTGHSI